MVLVRLYVLDICAFHKIDIDTIIEEKLEFNVTRPYRHGGRLS